jgi:tripartite-type tricarboxylate transporter receptor subunit TctC
MEALARTLGSSVTHIPFSGVATAMQSLLGGHVDALIGAPSTVMPQVEAGTVNAVVVVSKDRFPLAPGVPSLAEAGIDLDVSTHFAFYAPKGTPAPVAARLALVLGDAATDPGFRQALEATRTRVDVLPADVLARVLAEESARFGPLVATVKS